MSYIEETCCHPNSIKKSPVKGVFHRLQVEEEELIPFGECHQRD